jgi:type IV fimbrial biogenesis protein FimT
MANPARCSWRISGLGGRRRAGAARGFTLLELMVTLAVAIVLAAVATPSLRNLMVSSTVSSAGGDFTTALAQTRGLAIANNMCATLCTARVSATGSPTCEVPGAGGFQEGWIVFTNPACDADQLDPAAAGARLRQTQNAGADGYAIVASQAALYRLMFDPRGISTASAAGRFQITAPDDTANAYARTVCLDAAGRATLRRYTTSCN